jgi:hypothetical protein
MLKLGRLVLLTSAVTSIQFALRFAAIKSLSHLRERKSKMKKYDLENRQIDFAN